ncbi:MAG: hypothetical protein QOJ15_2357 [Bradyrhizobium sp.]|nr:hypothetical protein [Bradyrhizobium sp.]
MCAGDRPIPDGDDEPAAVTFLSLPLVGRVAAEGRSGGGSLSAFRMLSMTPGEISINIRIPEPQNFKALRLQKRVANLIRSSASRHSVLSAVGFNNKVGSERNEVDDVTTDRCLSPEMKAEWFQFTQLHPQFDFLRRETLAKCAGIFVCQGVLPSYPSPGGWRSGGGCLRKGAIRDNVTVSQRARGATPHPSHRSQRSRCATLPTRGRDKRAPASSNSPYLSSQTSSKRRLLYWLLSCGV